MDETKQLDLGTEQQSDDVEPLLKYKFLPLQFLINQKSKAKCLSVTTRFYAIGTSDGYALLLNGQAEVFKSYKVSSFPINEICCSGDLFVGVATNDGFVYVLNPNETSSVFKYQYQRPVLSVSLPRSYSSSKELICGGVEEKLSYHSKGLLGNKVKELANMEGEILSIKWNGRYLAWANSSGIRIYDFERQGIIAKLNLFTAQQKILTKMYPFVLAWCSASDLVLACGNRIIVYRVFQQPDEKGRLAAVVHQIDGLDFIVCGLAPFRRNVVAVLALYEPERPDTPWDAPVVRLLDLSKLPAGRCALDAYAHAELACDQLSFPDAHENGPCDYRMIEAASPSVCGCERVFVLSPLMLVDERAVQRADRIRWLMSRRRYEDALRLAEEPVEQTQPKQNQQTMQTQQTQQKQTQPTPKHTPDVSIKEILDCCFLEYIRTEEWQKAIALATSPKYRAYVREDAALMNRLVLALLQAQKLSLLPEIPIDTPPLAPRVYEAVLSHLLFNDTQRFMREVQRIPAQLYSAEEVLSRINELSSLRSKFLQLHSQFDALHSQQSGLCFFSFLSLSVSYSIEISFFLYFKHFHLISTHFPPLTTISSSFIQNKTPPHPKTRHSLHSCSRSAA